jgi:riboflavin kinase/FMN adenylyltransferase
LRYIAGSAAIGEPLVRPVLTVGNFDGVHLGHRRILETVAGRARDLDGQAVVYTFDPHPRKVLRPDRAPRLLTTLEQKIELLTLAGADAVVVEPFSRAFARVSADAFIREFIHERIQPVEVYVGYDFHFGRDREGSMQMLTETGPRLGFSVTIIPEVIVDERDVNSTRIRQLVAEARVEEATTMLGRPYAVRGKVVEGDRRGRDLGFPTANLESENEILPGSGVYAGALRFLDDGDPASGVERPAVINVGTRPTFEGPESVVAEAHLLGFDGNAYGRRVELCFQHRLRAERRFPGIEALKKQIGSDVVEARRRLGVS